MTQFVMNCTRVRGVKSNSSVLFLLLNVLSKSSTTYTRDPVTYARKKKVKLLVHTRNANFCWNAVFASWLTVIGVGTNPPSQSKSTKKRQKQWISFFASIFRIPLNGLHVNWRGLKCNEFTKTMIFRYFDDILKDRSRYVHLLHYYQKKI